MLFARHENGRTRVLIERLREPYREKWARAPRRYEFIDAKHYRKYLGLIDQILYGRVSAYYDSDLVPNTMLPSQYRNQFNSLRAAVNFWTASMFGNSSIPPNDH